MEKIENIYHLVCIVFAILTVALLLGGIAKWLYKKAGKRKKLKELEDIRNVLVSILPLIEDTVKEGGGLCHILSKLEREIDSEYKRYIIHRVHTLIIENKPITDERDVYWFTPLTDNGIEERENFIKGLIMRLDLKKIELERSILLADD